MKIRIQDFGPIRDFTFDLDKDLHLLYGKNGTGKSYAVYCVYMLMDSLTKSPSVLLSDQSVVTSAFKDLISKREDNGEEKVQGKSGTKQFEIAKLAVQNSIIDAFESSLKGSYASLSSLNNSYSKSNLAVTLTNGFNKLQIGISKHDSLTLTNLELAKEALEDFPESEEHAITSGKAQEKNSISFMSFQIYHLSFAIRFALGPPTIDNFFLPASRSGLYQGLTSLSPIIAELSKYRSSVTKTMSLPSLTVPVTNYFLALSTVDDLKENDHLTAIAKRLEREVLKGSVTYDIEHHRILFHPERTDLKLELSEASSMAAELAPIISFLKYIVKDYRDDASDEKDKSTILFIEEPEAHLHPEAQVKLMEILAELPKHNIKVVMTSHSNYMFNKLTNLILEKKVEPDKVATYHMVMTDEGSVVQDDMPVTEEGIEDSNFITVAEQLYEERMRLSSEMNE